MLIDTHAHLYADDFNDDIDTVIRRANDEGINKILLPNVDQESIDQLLELTKKHPSVCFPMVGIHPTSVKENYQQELDMVESQLKANKFVAIGEIGMDLYWDKTFIEEQKLVFTQQIRWASAYKLPIAIHSRDAFDETISVLKQEAFDGLTGVFHSFSGNVEQANIAIDLGFKIGVSGVVTFKNAGMDKVIKEIAPEHLVLETDAPYLTPVPYRGKRNESAYVRLIADKVAQLHNMPLKELAEITSNNAINLFNLS